MKIPQYLEFCRRHVCVVCANPETVAHHVKTIGAGGSDLLALPLCVHHHNEVHTMGKDTFQTRNKLDFRDAQLAMLCHFIESCSDEDPRKLN